MIIPKGTKIKYKYENEEDIFTIVDTRQLRSKYIYIFTDSKNKKQSLTRNQLLDALERGIFKII